MQTPRYLNFEGETIFRGIGMRMIQADPFARQNHCISFHHWYFYDFIVSLMICAHWILNTLPNAHAKNSTRLHIEIKYLKLNTFDRNWFRWLKFNHFIIFTLFYVLYWWIILRCFGFIIDLMLFSNNFVKFINSLKIILNKYFEIFWNLSQLCAISCQLSLPQWH